jgi:hypothetical protein
MSEHATWTAKVDVDEEGVITFTDELLKKLGWEEGDTINFDVKPDGTIFLTKVHKDGTKDGEVKLDSEDGN